MPQRMFRILYHMRVGSDIAVGCGCHRQKPRGRQNELFTMHFSIQCVHYSMSTA